MRKLVVSRSGDWKSRTQVTRVEGTSLVDLYFCARPARDGGPFLEQARSMYENFLDALLRNGATPRDVVAEKVFFSDVDSQFEHLGDVRRDCYGRRLRAADFSPATVFLQQPPCHPGRLCELQAHVVLPVEGKELCIRALDGMPGLASGKVVEQGGGRHIHLCNLTGGDGAGDGTTFEAQARDMLCRAQALLEREGASFRDVVRTWVYIGDIDRNYAAFNKVRTEAFRTFGVDRLPASTGIQGATYPRERGCAMDLYALAADHPMEIEVLRAKTMNEAPSYGSSFSRGMKVVREDRVVLYVSGTASIDTSGIVVHEGDIEGQVRRMLQNVEELLAGEGASLRDLVTGITYLKDRSFLEPFYRVCAEMSVPMAIPNTVSVADICRPQWLCEIEGMAVTSR